MKKTLVAIAMILAVGTLSAQSITPGDFDKQAHFKKMALASFGEYLTNQVTQKHIGDIVLYMAACGEKAGRTPQQMSKIYFMAEALDTWFTSFGVDVSAKRNFCWGVTTARDPKTVWSLSAETVAEIAAFYKQHEYFFQVVFTQFYKERYDIPFLDDLKATISTK